MLKLSYVHPFSFRAVRLFFVTIFLSYFAELIKITGWFCPPLYFLYVIFFLKQFSLSIFFAEGIITGRVELIQHGIWRMASVHLFSFKIAVRFVFRNNFLFSYLCRGHHHWLQLDRKVLEHEFPKKSGPLVLYFAVRYVITNILFFETVFSFLEAWIVPEFSSTPPPPTKK